MESYALPISLSGTLPFSVSGSRGRSVTKPAMKSFIQLQLGCWRAVMPCCGVGGPSTGRTKWRVLPGAWPTYPAEIPKVGSLRKHRCASLVLDPLFPVSLRLLKKAAPSLRNTTGQRSGFHAIGHIRRAARASRKLDPNATETSTPKVRELHSLVAGTGQKMRPDLISQPKK